MNRMNGRCEESVDSRFISAEQRRLVVHDKNQWRMGVNT